MGHYIITHFYIFVIFYLFGIFARRIHFIFLSPNRFVYYFFHWNISIPLQRTILVDSIVILRFLLSTKFGLILCQSDTDWNGRNIFSKSKLERIKRVRVLTFSINVNRRLCWEIW